VVQHEESPFIGREDLLTHLLSGLDDAQPVRADDVVGALGMGKSTLIEELVRRSPALATDVVVSHVDLGRFDPGSKGGGGTEQTFGQSLKSHDQLLQLARQILTAVDPGSVGRIDAVGDAGVLEIHRIKSSDVNVYAEVSAGSSATVSASPQSVTVNVDNKTALDADFVSAIRQAQVALTDALVGCLNETARSTPVLLLFDNADTVADQDLGLWIGRMISRLSGVVVVLTHEPDTALDLAHGLGTSLRLPPFSREEVAAFLARRLPQQPASDLVALLHEWSGGVPVALEILVDLMNDPDIHLGRAELENRLSRLPENVEGRLAGVVTEMVERLEGRALGKALRAASIPSECDIELLTNLLAGEGVPPDAVTDLMKNLEAFSFTEGYRSSLDGTYYIKVHPFIRRGLADHMRRYAPDEQERLHTRAARFFYDQLTQSATYGEMFDLEKPDQQLRLRKWLDHSARSGDERTAMLQGAKVFFDTFWWWGNYVYFDFCEKLAADFEDVASTAGAGDGFVAFAGAVRRFVTSYPYRAKLRQDFERTYPPAHWEEVEDALLEIRDLCNLAWEPTPGTGEVECHVAALTEVFLAHTYRFTNPADRVEARECYVRAERWFRLADRRWDVPWVVFERGDLALEDGDLALALHEATSAASLLYENLDEDAPDEELSANIHRLRGDCAWFSGDLAAAAREYGLAVLHSYLFHRVGGPPDDYTMQFYFEVRGRAIERVLQLWRSGRTAEAVQFAHALQEPFLVARTLSPHSDAALTAICKTGTISELAQALFPRGPELAELSPKATASDFMRELRRFQRRVQEKVARDLATV
jgi:hypothetical protein